MATSLATPREYATMATGLATQITRQCVYDSMVGVVLTKAQPTMWSRNASQGQPLHKVTSPIRHQRDTASVNKSLYSQRPCRWQGLTPHAHMIVAFVSISCVCAQPRLPTHTHQPEMVAKTILIGVRVSELVLAASPGFLPSNRCCVQKGLDHRYQRPKSMLNNSIGFRGGVHANKCP